MAMFEDAGRFWSRLKSPEKIAIGVLGIGIVAYMIYKLRSNSSAPIQFAAAPTPTGSGIPTDTGGSSGGSGSSGNFFDPTNDILTAIQQQQNTDFSQFQSLFQQQQQNDQTTINQVLMQNQNAIQALQASLTAVAAQNEGTSTPASNPASVNTALTLAPAKSVSTVVPSNPIIPTPSSSTPSSTVGANKPLPPAVPQPIVSANPTQGTYTVIAPGSSPGPVQSPIQPVNTTVANNAPSGGYSTGPNRNRPQ